MRKEAMNLKSYQKVEYITTNKNGTLLRYWLNMEKQILVIQMY